MAIRVKLARGTEKNVYEHLEPYELGLIKDEDGEIIPVVGVEDDRRYIKLSDCEEVYKLFGVVKVQHHKDPTKRALITVDDSIRSKSLKRNKKYGYIIEINNSKNTSSHTAGTVVYAPEDSPHKVGFFSRKWTVFEAPDSWEDAEWEYQWLYKFDGMYHISSFYTEPQKFGTDWERIDKSRRVKNV